MLQGPSRVNLMVRFGEGLLEAHAVLDQSRRDAMLRRLMGRDSSQALQHELQSVFADDLNGDSALRWRRWKKIERKLREAAHIITGCCKVTKVEFLLAEANLMPFSLKIEQNTTLLHESNQRLLPDGPAKVTDSKTVKPRSNRD